IKAYYVDKGYLNVQVGIEEAEAGGSNRKNMKVLLIEVHPGTRTKIEEIEFVGNSGVSDKKLKKAMAETKEKSIFRFKRSKFVEEAYESDKEAVIAYYNTKGYRDARI